MRYGKVMACILTLVFLAAAVGIGAMDDLPEVEAEPLALGLLVSSEAETERVSCWEQENGRYYFFLPGYTVLEETVFRLEDRREVIIDGQIISDGMSCENFQWETPYALSVTERGQTTGGMVTFLRSGQIPSMHIEVQSGNMNYIHAVKGNKESGRIRIYDVDGIQSFAGNLKSINGRGNDTWTHEKKPYSLELTAAADLLGMGDAKKWILFSNPGDASHIRNKFVFDFAQDVGLSYSPDCTWVDLYLNGEYAGLYLLSERNEIHPQRVNLEADNSFLVSMELGWRLENQGYPFISTDNGFDLRIHHSSMTETDLVQLWQSAENAILAENGVDPVTGKHWTELIDLDSWAEKYLIEEIFGSVDAGAVSQYFYADVESGKICAGPVWDYDIAMGNAGAWQLSQPEAFFADRSRLNAWADAPWFYALCRKEAFQQRVAELYKEVFRPLLESYLEEKLDAYTSAVSEAALLNQYRWQVYSLEKEAEYIYDYMTRRMVFLDSIWLEGESWHRVLVDINDGSNTACYAVRSGELLPELRDTTYIPDAIGWYYRDTDTPVDTTRPVDRDLDIYLKYETWEEEYWEGSDGLASQLSKVPFAVLLMILLAVVYWDFSRRKHRILQRKGSKPKVPHN